MKVIILHQFFSYFRSGTTISQYAVWQDYSNSSTSLYDRHNVLKEIHLIVCSFDDFWSVSGHLHTPLRTSSKWRIGHNHLIQIIKKTPAFSASAHPCNPNITVLQCYNVTTFYKNGTMYTGI